MYFKSMLINQVTAARTSICSLDCKQLVEIKNELGKCVSFSCIAQYEVKYYDIH